MIKLIQPTMEYGDAIMELRRELLEENPGGYLHGAGNLEGCHSAEEWICHVENMRQRESCPGDLVDSDIYLAVREEDNRIVGLAELRHHIEHPVLQVWGGHIGCTIRPTERRKGYAGQILCRILDICKMRGMDEVLITCGENNSASERTIRGAGGIYEKTVWVELIKSNMRRFWIKLR